MSCFPNKQGGGATSSPLSIYEFLIDQTTDDPASMISYTGANKDFIPAKMNFATGKFDYGSWKNTWIFNKFKPCMLHADGTVAYYLNPHNLTQKITGGDAMPDLTSTEHDMNAMVEVGQIWIKEEVIDDDHFHIYLSPTKQDDYDCWTHYNINNKLVDHYYTSMYVGSTDSNNKVRSLSRKDVTPTVSEKTLREYAQANGNGWDVHEWSFQRLMQYVLLLIGKTTDSQTNFGCGCIYHSTSIQTGGNETSGLFFGTQDRLNHVTVFAIEDLWGNMRGLTCGLIAYGTENLYVKMTPNTIDGSSGSNYSDALDDYISIPRPMGNEDYQAQPTKMKLIPKKGLFPTGKIDQSSPTKGWCDMSFYGILNQQMWAQCSGDWNDSYSSGLFSVFAYIPQSNSPVTDRSVALSYKNPK